MTKNLSTLLNDWVSGTKLTLEEVQHEYSFFRIPDRLSKYYKSNYVTIEGDVDAFMDEVVDKFNSKTFLNISHNLRSTMSRFIRNSSRGAGTTNVHNVGKYIVGEVPKLDDLNEQAKRSELEFLYARACAEGWNKASKDFNFIHNDNDQYESTLLAQIAIEAESLASKGPYDNGTPDLPFQVVETNLENALISEPIPDELIALFCLGFAELRLPILRSNTTRSRQPEIGMFAQSNANRGTASTLRGGFNASGDSFITFPQVLLYHWWFSHIKDRPFSEVHDQKSFNEHCWINSEIELPAEGVSEALSVRRKELLGLYKPGVKNNKFEVLSVGVNSIKLRRPLTVDEFIDIVNVDFFIKKHLSVYDVYTDKLQIMNNLMRDQGSPFKTSWKDGKLYVTGEQKERKVRQVIPPNAFVQSWLVAAGQELIDIAPHLPGREGMLHPKLNTEKLSHCIVEAWENDMFFDNFDLSKFDSTIIDQLIVPTSLAYASLYDNQWIKDVLSCLGLFSMRKFFIMPKRRNTRNRVWDKYKWKVIRAIKGDRDYSLRTAAQRTKNLSLQKQIKEAQLNAAINDYNAVLIFVPGSWEPSGIEFTNTQESDINIIVSGFCVPLLSCLDDSVKNKPALIEAVSRHFDPFVYKSINSGDDITATTELLWLKELGLDECRNIRQRAYAQYHWVLNASKMSRVTYRVEHRGETYYVPPLEFLQKIQYQNGTDKHFDQWTKFMRQLGAMGYLENGSNLAPVLQPTISSGRWDSAVAPIEDHIRFSASVLYYASQAWNDLVTRRHLKIKPTQQDIIATRTGDWIVYNPQCEAGVTKLLGHETFFGLVKKYGNELDAELTRYVMLKSPHKLGTSINTVIKELELRAPHRVGMANAMLKALSDQERHFFLKDMQLSEVQEYQHIAPMVLRAIENLGVKVTPLDLQSLDNSQSVTSPESESAQAEDSLDEMDDE